MPKTLKKALEAAGWDGEWYRRGSYDDGTPLGSRTSDECRIDSIAQSWSVLSGQGGPERALTAMRSASGMLVDERSQDHQAVHAALRQDREGSGLHQELSAGRARERRPVHARGDLVRHRACRARAGRRGLALLLHAQPDQPRARCRRRPNATASSPMSWPPTSIRPARSPGAAAGPGTPARPDGSTAPRSRRILGIRKQGNRIHLEPGHSHATGTASRRRCGLPAAVYRDRGRPRERV